MTILTEESQEISKEEVTTTEDIECNLVDLTQEEDLDSNENSELTEAQEVENSEDTSTEMDAHVDSEEIPSILRTASDGCWEIYTGAWGRYLRPTFDPEANAVITEDHLKEFELKEDIHRIPAELWSKWVKLCFYYVDKVQSSVEVSMRILRSQEDPSQYRILVPRQKVSGASVRVDSFDEAIDIATGEEISSYPPEGWTPVGSSHSHNTMAAFFSGTDDKYELGDPGIHIVVGTINTKTMRYTIAASVVGSGRRFSVPFEKLIDATPIATEFAPKVLDYVDYTSTVSSYSVKGGYNNYGTGTTWTKKLSSGSSLTTDKTDWTDYRNWGWEEHDYTDPFYWSNQYNGNVSNMPIWQIMDIAKDYVKKNANYPQSLKNLRDEMYDFLVDLEVFLTDM